MIPLSITTAKSVGEIVAEDYRTASIFKQYGIDFCCGGKKSLEQVCTSKGINTEELNKSLELVHSSTSRKEQNFDAWSLPLLSEYIVQKHHTYVREQLPLLEEYSNKIARVHGETHPENRQIAVLIGALSRELSNHLDKEEQILFPWIKKISNTSINHQSEAGLEGPVLQMEAEHEIAGEIMHQIRKLSQNYTLPKGACNTWRVLWSLLSDFEEDLHEHVHLENNILFPKALRLQMGKN